MAKKAKSPQYGTYQSKGSYTTNKKRKIEKHLKSHPNDNQSLQALKNVGPYSRKKPTSKLGWINESVRNASTYVPAVSSKGHTIGIRSPEHLAELKKTSMCQSVPLTREYATKLAQVVAKSYVI